MALQDEQQITTASSDNHSLETANTHSDRLPRSSLQPTVLNAAALQEKHPIECQEEFKMQVLKEPKCGPTWSGLEEQGGQVESPGGAQSSSTPTVSSHQHKALGSPCFSHLRRQQVATVYHGILISVCLCLQMPILAAETVQARGPCNPVMNNLDGRADLSCKLTYPPHAEKIQKMCSKSPDSQVVYLCKDGRDRPEENMTEYAGWPIRWAEPEVCNGTIMLTFLNYSWNSNCTLKNGRKVEGHLWDTAYIMMTIMLFLALLAVFLIRSEKMRNKLKNLRKNRNSKSQPSTCHRTSQAIQIPYVPAPNTDPEDDDLHSVATDGSADTATATADIHDAIPGETSANPTKDPCLSGVTTMDTSLTADSESINAYDSEAHDSAYCDSCDSVSLGSEACGSAVAAFLAAEVKNELLSKCDSQKQVEMQVFAVNRQVYNPEYC